ncbi:ABC transporter ATP-binding protein [Quadrisphaera setariae]|uniref:ABC transporter ATP-binding protein n=1 Tax=Quadrisphaera setariae TaxID=2593304 RepID=A0A5C8ZHI6_9ACTN|nr:ABC transporter ATP-binding protein [Quadrisphaera setariae]TXR56631.1 ABC transporter ATP-binding protein [Quadrisphaera setariae]
MSTPDASSQGDVLLSARGLAVHYPGRGTLLRRAAPPVKAVDGVDLDVRRGETYGLVGESGCGKSTLGRALLRLTEPTAGTVSLDGTDLRSLGTEQLRRARRRMQMVFQDPMASLDPRMDVEAAVAEPLRAHGLFTGRGERGRRVRELLGLVGLPASAATRYPHEFSGGQRQRIGIARALAAEPALVVADEPVSALDVSVQAQVLNLLEDLQEALGLTYVLIAHDLAVVRHSSDRVGVMYLGGIVEEADSDDLYAQPLHPYTLSLMSAVPVPDPSAEDSRERILLTGDLPSPADPPTGCRFHTRCPFVQPTRCADERPQLRELGLPGAGAPAAAVRPPGTGTPHRVACHWAEAIRDGQLQPSRASRDPAAVEPA